MKIYAEKRLMQSGVDLFFVEEHDGGGISVGKPMGFEKHPSEMVSNPTITIKNKEAQMIMDELWQCGLRPSEGTGSAGALRATEKHLEDMRKLVFEVD